MYVAFIVFLMLQLNHDVTCVETLRDLTLHVCVSGMASSVAYCRLKSSGRSEHVSMGMCLTC